MRRPGKAADMAAPNFLRCTECQASCNEQALAWGWVTETLGESEAEIRAQVKKIAFEVKLPDPAEFAEVTIDTGFTIPMPAAGLAKLTARILILQGHNYAHFR